jgi:hypothetical protein
LPLSGCQWACIADAGVWECGRPELRQSTHWSSAPAGFKPGKALDGDRASAKSRLELRHSGVQGSWDKTGAGRRVVRRSLLTRRLSRLWAEHWRGGQEACHLRTIEGLLPSPYSGCLKSLCENGSAGLVAPLCACPALAGSGDMVEKARLPVIGWRYSRGYHTDSQDPSCSASRYWCDLRDAGAPRCSHSRGSGNLLRKPLEMRQRRTGFPLPAFAGTSFAGMTSVSKGIPFQMTPAPASRSLR